MALRWPLSSTQKSSRTNKGHHSQRTLSLYRAYTVLVRHPWNPLASLKRSSGCLLLHVPRVWWWQRQPFLLVSKYQAQLWLVGDATCVMDGHRWIFSCWHYSFDTRTRLPYMLLLVCIALSSLLLRSRRRAVALGYFLLFVWWLSNGWWPHNVILRQSRRIYENMYCSAQYLWNVSKLQNCRHDPPIHNIYSSFHA